MAGNKKKKKATASSNAAVDDKDQQADSKTTASSSTSSAVVKATVAAKSAQKPRKDGAARDTVVTDLAAAFAKQVFAPSIKITRNKYDPFLRHAYISSL